MTEPPFYVGYGRFPKALKRPILLVLAALFAIDAALALTLVIKQPAPPSGHWGTAQVHYDGLFQARPYPLLRIADGKSLRTILLVSEGKHGAPDGLGPLDGKHIAVSGYEVKRGDLTVLQLDSPPAPADGPPPAAKAQPLSLQLAMTGEIADSKCWAGAMVPGEGKTHKGCGALCLLGNIPALFVVTQPDGSLQWFLLADKDGGPIGDAARALVGERVRLTGTLHRSDGLDIFQIDSAHPSGAS